MAAPDLFICLLETVPWPYLRKQSQVTGTLEHVMDFDLDWWWSSMQKYAQRNPLMVPIPDGVKIIKEKWHLGPCVHAGKLACGFSAHNVRVCFLASLAWILNCFFWQANIFTGWRKKTGHTTQCIAYKRNKYLLRMSMFLFHGFLFISHKHLCISYDKPQKGKGLSSVVQRALLWLLPSFLTIN